MCKKERTWIEAVFYSMFTVGIITIILLLISLIQKLKWFYRILFVLCLPILIFPMLIWESRIYAPDWFIKWIDKMY